MPANAKCGSCGRSNPFAVNILVQKWIEQVPSACPFCDAQGTYIFIQQEHMKICTKRIEKCQFDGCALLGTCEELAQHVQMCPFAQLTCPCAGTFLRKDWQVIEFF